MGRMAAFYMIDPSDWEARLRHLVETMRVISRQTDPHALTQAYSYRIRALEDFDRYVSISRRDLEWPHFRVTRDSEWAESIDPWKERDRLPLLSGGLIADIIYSDDVAYMTDYHVPDDDPAAPYVAGYRTLIAVPHFDQGRCLNMVLHLRRGVDFDPSALPSLVWESSLFGRMTYNLVLSSRLREANDALARELASVGEVQRTLLPAALEAPGLSLAAHYRPSTRAGGDYYDIFHLPDGSVGLFIADVAGHGAPAAVLMAVVHSIAHGDDAPTGDPAAFLAHLDRRIALRYSHGGRRFVTAFYALLDPSRRRVAYARAGHPPPRLLAPDGTLSELDGAARLPLGLDDGARAPAERVALEPGAVLTLLTDGVTEARSPHGELFGSPRVDRAILGRPRAGHAHDVLTGITGALDSFMAGCLPDDDQTLLVAAVGE